MLQRLELIGFKSFADKTIFDFSPGLTAIVGPNGSGKSNIIDAVRWVLGEQSAKSLRGGEMADVIFNGSSTRRSLGMAEVTMTFDNSRKILAVDAEEVQITRRVYRDGQGEYLINRQPSLLREIKDLFLGSGAGQGAYAIIEQGRVDALLQASHKERRALFEEAAGISRFKARKVETLRKLEHVEQNLSRSRDILAEVEKQLRSVRLQAAKAQRYQEYNERLRELRIDLGLRDYHELTVQLQAEEQLLEQLRQELQQTVADSARQEDSLRRIDALLAGLEEQLHEVEARLALARQQIAAEDATRSFETNAASELESELTLGRQRRLQLAARISETAAAAAQARSEWQAGEAKGAERREHTHALEDRLAAVKGELSQLRLQVEADRSEHLERMRQTARLQNDVTSLRTRLDNLCARRDGLQQRSAAASEHLACLNVELDELLQQETNLQQLLAESRTELGRREEERELLRKQLEEARQRLAELRVQRSGLASRIELLEQLENRHEGLGAGVREVLELVELSKHGSPTVGKPAQDWSFILGLVADCLTVPRELAPLIDLALGDLAQCFIVRDSAALDAALARLTKPFAGRVGFIPVAAPAEHSLLVVDSTEVGQHAELLVHCDRPDLASLPRQLLGKTRLVPDLATARSLACMPESAGLRFVTMQGELLEADGTLTVGAHHADTGILSRKSEMRELRQQAIELDYRITDADQEQGNLKNRADTLEQPIIGLQEKISELIDEAREMSVRVSLQREKRTDLHDEVAVNRNEIDMLVQEINGLEVNWWEAKQKADESEQHAQRMQQRMAELDRTIREREMERLEREHECSQARVEWARMEEQLAGLHDRAARLESEWKQRQQELAGAEKHERAMDQRLRENQLTLLNASACLAECFLQKEQAEQQITELSQERDQRRAERRQLADEVQNFSRVHQEGQNQAHTRELQASQLRSRRDGIADRLREDYQVELGHLYEQWRANAEWGMRNAESNVDSETAASVAAGSSGIPNSESRVPSSEVQKEIEELRRKLSRLGAVNLEALQELTDLEKRSTELQTQHDDLTRSQMQLLEIIHRINQDSKKLFSETFVSIRTHFQELFRKLFGGGLADIILEDENDLLECGIEINARPPGKELRSISLMSGGERTLTAIALLLAIFRSKPSPFCLLDEVDAALDEANNVRLAGVLREFLDISQFIVVTHKKRTMAVADILYGITMQEAGVSRQISVRFEDWPEDGEKEPARVAG
ncbi:MAG TPA: chromosome segregation protein SMC [Gemmataceae bacterium]|nr:chromosome segregation protein SMC [Gemmataceae bacterium]